MIAKYFFVFLYLSTFSMTCSSNENTVPEGNFIKGIGSEIAVVNFKNGSKKVVYELEGLRSISDKIYQIDSETVLLSDGRTIFSLDVEGNRIEKWGKGYGPVFLRKHNKVLYYGKDAQGKGGIVQAEKYLKNPVLVAETSRYGYPNIIVPISDDEVVFQKGFSDSSRREFWKFELESNELTRLDLPTDCELLNVWRSRKGQVLCRKITADRFASYTYFLDITNGEEERLKSDDYLAVGHYLADQDAFIVQEVRVARGIEHLDLWIYSITDGQKYKLMEDAGFGIDAFTKLEAMD